MSAARHFFYKTPQMSRRDYFVEMAQFRFTVRKDIFLPGESRAAVRLLVAVSDDDYM